MSINQINSSDFDYEMMLATINVSYVGKETLTITEYSSTAAPDVTAGSIFENGGAIFENTTDATPTGYAGLTNSTTFYLYYDESGGVFIFSNTAPVWSDAKQGWYNGDDRAFFSMFKDSGGTLYENKSILSRNKNYNFLHEAAITYNTLFDRISPFVPIVGDMIQVNGGLGPSVVSRIEKTGASEITFYYLTSAGNIGSVAVADGAGTTIDVSLTW